jgi:hypothetical protein
VVYCVRRKWKRLFLLIVANVHAFKNWKGLFSIHWLPRKKHDIHHFYFFSRFLCLHIQLGMMRSVDSQSMRHTISDVVVHKMKMYKPTCVRKNLESFVVSTSSLIRKVDISDLVFIPKYFPIEGVEVEEKCDTFIRTLILTQTLLSP